MRHVLSVIAVAVGLLAHASTLGAQRPFAVGLSAGPSLPASQLNESHKPGFSAAAHVGFRMPASAVGFRLEAFYNVFGNTEFTCAGPCISPGFGSGKIRITGAAANVVFNLGAEGAFPYVITGAGSYRVSQEQRASRTHLGLNAGVGARFDLARTVAFIEARFHTIRDTPRVEYIPLTIGIEF